MSSSSKKAPTKRVAKPVASASKVNSKPATSNRKLLLLLIPALLIGFVVSFFAVQQFGNKDSASKTGDKPVYSVDLRKENKDPIDLLIKKGEFVQFNSKDGQQHQIVKGGHSSGEHGGGGMVDSGVFDADEGYQIQFNEVGKFDFHDNLDRDYTITVIVYDPTKSLEDIKIKR
ncbi:MAG: cupredoxin domain-containing protein [Candidatus Saccharimonadales bacterium]